MFDILIIIIFPLMNRPDKRLCFFDTFSQFLIFQVNESLLLFKLWIHFSKRPLKLIESTVSWISVDRWLLFSKDSFEHMFVLELDIKLSQMRFMLIWWINGLIFDGLTQILREFCVYFGFCCGDIVIMWSLVLKINVILWLFQRHLQIL